MNSPAHCPDRACGCGHEPATAPRGWNVIGCLILVLWGCVMLYFYGSGRIEHYLTGSGPFRMQCLLGGIGLLLLGSINLGLMFLGKPIQGHDGPPAGASGVVTLVLLVLPLTLAPLLSPDRYSDAFFMMKVQAAPPATVSMVTEPNAFGMDELVRLSGGLTAGGDIPLDLELVLQLASQPDDVRKVIESARVETVGQIVRDPADPSRWRLSRLLITCCAADARAVSVTLAYDGDPSQWRPLGWYRTVGRIALDSTRVPIFQVESAAPVDPPRLLMID